MSLFTESVSCSEGAAADFAGAGALVDLALVSDVSVRLAYPSFSFFSLAAFFRSSAFFFFFNAI